MIPPFNQPLAPGGYAWWYIDAISDDRRHGLTLIAFIGSVFSPYYAWARSRGHGDPMNHCAINVALYGPKGRWCMTERGRDGVLRDQDSLAIGPSSLHWDGETLSAELCEWSSPLPRRILGKVKLRPTVLNGEPIALDRDGRHHWTPISPAAQVEVDLQTPDLRWTGSGYFDHNAGSEPLEQCFDTWFWSRAETTKGPVVLYELQRSEGQDQTLVLHFDNSGARHELAAPPKAALPPTRWGIERPLRTDDGRASLLATWEDTPFYARSLFSARLHGEQVTAVHESLSLRRLSAPWVQFMLPFRMPRRRR